MRKVSAPEMSAPLPSSAFVSVREFARLDGCDDKLVRRAIKAGKQLILGDGKLDPALAGSGWRKQNRRTVGSADRDADTGKMSAQGARTNVRAEKVSAPTADEAAAAGELSTLMGNPLPLQWRLRLPLGTTPYTTRQRPL